ncbi:PH domain-containing protein [Intrasporangium calvum]|uniref:Membrane-flanked domain n=1 Tax=Intrasporangium calvum (strain ATCC 23552 / DSM 43043 / JCM 3097 / NBRC 12989 / NCIMB 10167 / NRRL B-3866 / 7 KIP) TaxID=710696 RepID=E6SEF6_INTC7|nr:PH domain-containing protein [Intrasporangium calvum]ADU49833.1 membrane-flanked domain [Intrasporangium calvum DSM 43043]
MGFPENVLAQGERVERSIHPHWLTVAGPVLFGLVLAAGAGFAVVATPDDSRGDLLQWVLVAVAVLIAVPAVVVPFLRWRTTHYVVTSHRVMVRRGILRKSGKDITLSKITDVSFEQSLVDRIINSGSLRIESAGDSPDEQLRNIPHSNHVQQLINRLIDEDDTRRRLVAQGRAAHGRPGYETAEEDDDGRMPLGSDGRRRDRPELAEE